MGKEYLVGLMGVCLKGIMSTKKSMGTASSNGQMVVHLKAHGMTANKTVLGSIYRVEVK
jgi:hypothetical protein